MRLRLNPSFAVLVLVTFTATGLAHAQGGAPASTNVEDKVKEGRPEPTEQAKAEAKQRFARGIELYQEGDYNLALIEFERVYDLVPDYRVLYNIGQVSIQLGRYARATRALSRYLAEGGEKLDPERVSAVQADLEMLKGRTAYLTITTNLEGAQIFLDDRLVGVAPLKDAILVDAGEHRVNVRKPGFNSTPTQVTLAGGEKVSVDVALTAEPQRKPETVIVERPAPGAGAEEREPKTAMWIGWSTTGALAASAAVFGILGISARTELEDDKNNPTTAANQERVLEEREEQERRAKTMFMTADILGAAAIVAGGVSLYLTFKPSSKPEQERAGQIRARLTGQQLLLSTTF